MSNSIDSLNLNASQKLAAFLVIMGEGWGGGINKKIFFFTKLDGFKTIVKIWIVIKGSEYVFRI